MKGYLRTLLFSDLIVWYLFLGGLGGGLCLSALYIDVRARSGAQHWVALRRTTRQPALIGSFLALAVGSVCLMKDLALPEKALLLFIKPTPSAITVGTYALTGLLVSVAVLIVLGVIEKKSPHPALFRTAWFLSAVLACVVIVYTGLLLSSISAVPLWLSGTVPVLFTLSSLSSGIAGITLLAAFFQPALSDLVPALRSLIRADAIIIVLEIAAVVVLGIHLIGNAAALASAETLVFGRLSLQFWIGFFACGLAVPILLELFAPSWLSIRPAFSIALGCLILVGAYFLRYCIVFGGIHLSAFMFA